MVSVVIMVLAMAIPHPGELAALATVLCWAVSVLCFDAAGRRVGSMAVNLLRLLIALTMLCLFMTFAYGRPLPLHAPAGTWLWLGASGLVGFFLGDLCLFRSFLLIGPRLSTLLMSLAPPVAALTGMALLPEQTERLTPLNWAGMGVTLAGVACVVLEPPLRGPAHRRIHVTPWGLLLGALAAVGQGLGMVLAKKGMLQADGTYFDPIASTQIRQIAGIAGFATLFLALRWYPRVVSATRDAGAMGFITLGALAGPVAGVSLALLSLQFIPTGKAQTIMAILPVVIIPTVILIHKEHVSLRAVVGAVVAFAGVAMLFLNS